MKPEYKIAFFDVDGTLRATGKHCVPESTISAIDNLKNIGVKVIICSGRNYTQMPEYIRSIGFDYFICFAGALITDSEGNIIRLTSISKETAVKLKRSFIEQNCTYSFKFLSGKNIQYNGDMDDFISLFFKSSYTAVKDVEVNLDEEVLLAGVYKDPRNNLENTRKEFPMVNFVYVAKNYYDFNAVEATKGNAIRYICDMLQINQADTIAFGDGENDLTMFESVGMSVAMGNASDVVKKSAKYVTADVEEDGVYKAVEKFFSVRSAYPDGNGAGSIFS